MCYLVARSSSMLLHIIVLFIGIVWVDNPIVKPLVSKIGLYSHNSVRLQHRPGN